MIMAIGHFSTGVAMAIILFGLIDYYSKRITLRDYLK